MANDKGHANNVAHLQELITHIQTYGAAYNPKNPILEITALQALMQDSVQTLQDVNAALAEYKIAVDNRKLIFASLNPVISRSLNALKVSGVSKEVYESAAASARKVIGDKQKKVVDTAAVGADEPPSTTHSTAQMSFDNRVANFNTYLAMLDGISEYDPNETDLKKTALKQLLQNLFAANQAVTSAEAELSAKRGTRNSVLYSKDDSLVEVGQMVKDYVKSVFGMDSSEFRQIRKLTFTSYN